MKNRRQLLFVGLLGATLITPDVGFSQLPVLPPLKQETNSPKAEIITQPELAEDCHKNPTGSCIYETIIVHLQYLTGPYADAMWHIRRKRTDIEDQLLSDLIQIGEQDLAKAYALRLMAQRDFYQDVANDKKLLSLNNQIFQDNQVSEQPASNELNLFFNKDFNSKHITYWNNCYQNTGPKNSINVKECLSNKQVPKTYRPYMDHIRASALSDASSGLIKEATQKALRLVDLKTINYDLGLGSVPLMQQKSDSTFEFLEAMIGSGAGTDKKVYLIAILLAEADYNLTNNQENQAIVLISQAENVASELVNPSISYSKSLVLITEAYAKANHFEKAEKNLEKLIEVCCEEHPENKRLMQDKRHLDVALRAMVNAALQNGKPTQAVTYASRIVTADEKSNAFIDIAEAVVLENPVNAENYIQEAISIFEKNISIDDKKNQFRYPEVQGYFYNRFSQYFLKSSNPQKAENFLNQAIQVYLPVYNQTVRQASISHGRALKYEPLQEILNSLIEQRGYDGFRKHIDPIAKSIWKVKLAEVIMTAAKHEIDVRNEDNLEKLIEFSKSFKPEQRSENQLKIQKQIVKSLGEITLRIFKEDQSNATDIYELYKREKTLLQEQYSAEYGGLLAYPYTSDEVALDEIIQAKHQKVSTLSENTMQKIYLPIRVRYSSNGGAYARKSSKLFEVSKLLYDNGYKQNAKQSLDLAWLMADRVSSKATRAEVPIDARTQTQQYLRLAKEYLQRGDHASAQRVQEALVNPSQRIQTNGTDRSIYLFQQQLFTDLVLSLSKNGQQAYADKLVTYVNHPLYSAIVSDNQALNLTFSDFVKLAWDDEEITRTAYDMLLLADIRKNADNNAGAEELISYVETMGNSFTNFRHRAAQIYVMLYEYYNRHDQTEKALEAIKTADTFVKKAHLQKQYLQGIIAENLEKEGAGDQASASLQEEAKTQLHYFLTKLPNKNIPGDYVFSRLLPIAKTMTELEGGIEPNTKQRLLDYIKNATLLPAKYHKGRDPRLSYTPRRDEKLPTEFTINVEEVNPYERGLEIQKEILKHSKQ